MPRDNQNAVAPLMDEQVAVPQAEPAIVLENPVVEVNIEHQLLGDIFDEDEGDNDAMFEDADRLHREEEQDMRNAVEAEAPIVLQEAQHMRRIVVEINERGGPIYMDIPEDGNLVQQVPPLPEVLRFGGVNGTVEEARGVNELAEFVHQQRIDQQRRADEMLRHARNERYGDGGDEVHRVGLRNNPFGDGRRPGAANLVQDGERYIPEEIVEPRVYPRPNVKKAPPARKAVSTQAVKPKEYLEEGWRFEGYTFSRKLTSPEQQALYIHGYNTLVKKVPDLIYKEKEKPVNDTEEVIVTVFELADFYATEECKRTVVGFDIKVHNSEYQDAYKRHVNAISGFKRNKNG